eukprot:365981-Chlamydomonas_euryale.AAC.15
MGSNLYGMLGMGSSVYRMLGMGSVRNPRNRSAECVQRMTVRTGSPEWERLRRSQACHTQRAKHATPQYTAYGRYRIRLFDKVKRDWVEVLVDDWIPVKAVRCAARTHAA